MTRLNIGLSWKITRIRTTPMRNLKHFHSRYLWIIFSLGTVEKKRCRQASAALPLPFPPLCYTNWTLCKSRQPHDFVTKEITDTKCWVELMCIYMGMTQTQMSQDGDFLFSLSLSLQPAPLHIQDQLRPHSLPARQPANPPTRSLNIFHAQLTLDLSTR